MTFQIPNLSLVVLVGVYFMARILDLVTLLWLLQTFLGSLFIIIIVFQDDIRRALTQVGRTPFQKSMDMVDKDIEEIVRTVFYLSKRRIGALIVIERDMGLRDYIESGFHIDARLTREMLISIFMPVSAAAGGIKLTYANFPPAPTFPCVQMERWKTEMEKYWRTPWTTVLKSWRATAPSGATKI